MFTVVAGWYLSGTTMPVLSMDLNVAEYFKATGFMTRILALEMLPIGLVKWLF